MVELPALTKIYTHSPTLLPFGIFPTGQEILWPHSNWYYIQCCQRKLPLVLPTHLWHRLKPEQLFSNSEHSKRMNLLETPCYSAPIDKHRARHCIIPHTQNPRASTAEPFPWETAVQRTWGKDSSTKLYPPLNTWKIFYHLCLLTKTQIIAIFFSLILTREMKGLLCKEFSHFCASCISFWDVPVHLLMLKTDKCS